MPVPQGDDFFIYADAPQSKDESRFEHHWELTKEIARLTEDPTLCEGINIITQREQQLAVVDDFSPLIVDSDYEFNELEALEEIANRIEHPEFYEFASKYTDHRCREISLWQDHQKPLCEGIRAHKIVQK